MQLGTVLVGLGPGDGRQHVHGKIPPGLGDQGLGQARVDPAVEQLARRIGAQPALPFLHGRELGQLQRSDRRSRCDGGGPGWAAAVEPGSAIRTVGCGAGHLDGQRPGSPSAACGRFRRSTPGIAFPWAA